MKTIYLISLLMAGTVQAQTIGSSKLTQAVNGTATNGNREVFSSQSGPSATFLPVGAAPAQSFGNSLRFSYSNGYQVGLIFGLGGDFPKIQQSAIEVAAEWPGLIEDAVREGLKESARRTGRNENSFLTTDNLNANITRLRARPEWQDLINTATSLKAVQSTTPTFKEAGGFRTGLQFQASSPLVDPNGTPNYSRVITSFSFTVR